MDLRELLFLKAMKGGGGGYVKATATGNPLTFNTDVAKPLKSLLIPWTPTQSGSGDPSPENVRPISGVSGLTVYHSGADTSNPTTYNVTFPALGKNLFDKNAVVRKDGYTIDYNGEKQTSQTSGYTENFVPITPGVTYAITGAGLRVPIFYDEDKNFISRISGQDPPIVITAPSNSYFVRFQYLIASVDFDNWQLEKGNQASTFEPYTNTVYGGTLDLTTGVLTVDWAVVNSKNVTWGYSSYDHVYIAYFTLPKKHGIDNFVIDEYKTVKSRFVDLVDYDARGNVANSYVCVKNSSIDSPQGFSETDFNICYELATPQTYQLTPQQITALVGDNTIWSDTNGSNTAVYLKRG